MSSDSTPPDITDLPAVIAYVRRWDWPTDALQRARLEAIITAAEASLSAADRIEADLKRIEELESEVSGWRECALYDATMNGPVFKGWDRSALDRVRRRALEGTTNG